MSKSSDPAASTRPANPSPMQRRQQLCEQLCRAPTTGLDDALDALGARALSPNDAQARHAIVVLGVPVAADGALSAGLRLRVQRAAQEARQSPAALVLVTGAAVANRFIEAEAMAGALVRRGIDAKRIYIEPHARTTLDNAAFSFAFLERLWPQEQTRPLHLTVVTEPYHAPRALRLFAAAAKTFDRPIMLHMAAAEEGPTPAYEPLDAPVSLSRKPLHHDFLARLSRCIEEKRRIACGW